MAHFAKIENGIVVQVIVVSNNDAPGEFPESEAAGVAFCKSLFGEDTEWRQTSYNSNFRNSYAGIGYTYNEELDAFISPKPYTSWILNLETLNWNSPTQYPQDGKFYDWDEVSLSWIEIQIETN